MLNPAELWQESGRWEIMGDDMFRLKDRFKRDFCLGMTHEEGMTAIARSSPRAIAVVIPSSCVMPRQKSRLKRSFNRNMSSPMISHRPDSCHSSAGFSHWQQHLLGAGGIHFFAHDLRDFQQSALREKKIAINAGGELADIAGAQ